MDRTTPNRLLTLSARDTDIKRKAAERPACSVRRLLHLSGPSRTACSRDRHLSALHTAVEADWRPLYTSHKCCAASCDASLLLTSKCWQGYRDMLIALQEGTFRFATLVHAQKYASSICTSHGAPVVTAVVHVVAVVSAGLQDRRDSFLLPAVRLITCIAQKLTRGATPTKGFASADNKAATIECLTSTDEHLPV